MINTHGLSHVSISCIDTESQSRSSHFILENINVTDILSSQYISKQSHLTLNFVRFHSASYMKEFGNFPLIENHILFSSVSNSCTSIPIKNKKINVFAYPSKRTDS